MNSVSSYEQIYKRARIDPSSRSIRLVSLSGQKRGSKEIEVHLEPFELRSVPPYTAISYTWGDPRQMQGQQSLDHKSLLATDVRFSKLNTTAPSRRPRIPEPLTKIKVNGEDLLVTENLRAFLVHARGLTTTSHSTLGRQWYWIDALSINQGDNEERTHQVGMMGDIYSSASLVQIWLGPGDKHSNKAIEHMEKVVEWGGSVMYIPSDVEAHVTSLFHRRYWSRIWIFQEILLANTVNVSCGDKVTTWETFDQFQAMLDRSTAEGLLKGDAEPIFGSNALRLIRNKRSTTILKSINRALALAYLIQITGPMDATDPRDKVYGLLGLSERFGVDCSAPSIQVNYEKNLRTIASDVLCYLTKGGAVESRSHKLLITKLLKESLGISAHDAYLAAQASGNFTNEDLDLLEQVFYPENTWEGASYDPWKNSGREEVVLPSTILPDRFSNLEDQTKYGWSGA